MPTTHTVVQGETLTRIARKYKYGSWQALYNHPDNAEFKKLRDNPNLIFPGDKIVIPDIEPKLMDVGTAKQHVFCVSKSVEKLKLKLQNGMGRSLQGKRIVLNVGGQLIDMELGDDGVVEAELLNGNESEGNLEVFMDPNSDEPTHKFELKLGHLDPVDELSGVQARCNMLGHDCGVADGIMGAKTRSGVKSFQKAHGLDVDGVPGPITKAKLKEVYGC